MSNATSRRAAAAEATQPLSFNLILAEYRDFFEVALHSILFTRRVYPSALFDQQARWGVAAQRARHPDVQSYIDNALKHVLEEIGRGFLSTVTLVILEKEGRPCERWSFALDDLLSTGLAGPPAKAARKANAPTPEQLHPRFADALVRIAATASALPSLHLCDDASFTIIVESPPDARPPQTGFSPALDAYTDASATSTTPKQQWVHLVPTNILDLAVMLQTR